MRAAVTAKTNILNSTLMQSKCLLKRDTCRDHHACTTSEKPAKEEEEEPAEIEGLVDADSQSLDLTPNHHLSAAPSETRRNRSTEG